MFKKVDNINMQLSSYEIDRKNLKLILPNNGIKEIKFDYPIRQVVQFKSSLLIRIEPGIGKILNENVYCYSSEGEFLWQVQPTDTIDVDSPYTNIVIREEKLFFYNWSGEKVQIDPFDGRILNKKFTK